MCGQLGVIYGNAQRDSEEQTYLKWLFMYLMLLSERRGPYATGVAWLKTDGSHSIFKLPIPAKKFIQEKQFTEVLAEVDDDTTWLAGHTRWPTRGSVGTIANSQPIRNGACILTHNGTVFNADALFKRLKLPRSAEVDSEIIARMADGTLHDGRIDIPAFKERLELCRGQISAVTASKLDPKTVVIIKGNKPLELRYHPEHHTIIYASDPAYLDVALTRETGWEEIITKPMTIMSINVDDLPHFDSVPFKLARTGGRHAFERYVESDNEGEVD